MPHTLQYSSSGASRQHWEDKKGGFPQPVAIALHSAAQEPAGPLCHESAWLAHGQLCVCQKIQATRSSSAISTGAVGLFPRLRMYQVQVLRWWQQGLWGCCVRWGQGFIMKDVVAVNSNIPMQGMALSSSQHALLQGRKLRKLLLLSIHPLQSCGPSEGPQSPAVLKDPIAQTHRGSCVHVKRVVDRIPAAKHWPKPVGDKYRKALRKYIPKNT